MSSTPQSSSQSASPNHSSNSNPNPATIASFSPSNSHTSPSTRQSATIQVNRKSPLLIATPPEVTRALAFSHPFLLPLNKIIGLLTWSSGDPWESFLVVAAFWALVLYGDIVIRWIGPIVVVICLILGMHSRRYSPLSSTGWNAEKEKANDTASESTTKHQKSLDEIVDTLKEFTSRCNILMEPLLQLTDFLSTQRTATSATTQPSLTTLFIRVFMIMPLWVGLTFPPFYIITSRRVVLTFGTLFLSWHSRPSRVSRTILWRSLTFRHFVSIVTGLSFVGDSPSIIAQKAPPPPLPPRKKRQTEVANMVAALGPMESSGVRFTFVVYENQRRWLGLGWTSSMFAYERGPWTDEHLNPSPTTDDFELPEVEDKRARWRWIPGSEWRIEGAGKGGQGTNTEGWIYYDSKWNDGRRHDGWGRYTRRRKWYRDTELVEVLPDQDLKSTPSALDDVQSTLGSSKLEPSPVYSKENENMNDSSSNQVRRRGFFRKGSKSSTPGSAKSFLSSDNDSDHLRIHQHEERNGDWGIGDDVKMGLG